MAKTYSVWPQPFSEQTDITLDIIEKQLKTDAISQKDLNLLLVNQLKVINKHMEEMTQLQNNVLLRDVQMEGE